MQWNIRNIKSNRKNVISLIREHKPDIILLNETWLSRQNKFYIKNFHVLKDKIGMMVMVEWPL